MSFITGRYMRNGRYGSCFILQQQTSLTITITISHFTFHISHFIVIIFIFFYSLIHTSNTSVPSSSHLSTATATVHQMLHFNSHYGMH
ncbi:hypothetical protein QVD17_31015 [Tagetes erecta]|uniref:Uncharacterized protein n=1 Tax=Tagetes erecta TaxID=13708 RepID=A0AAD8K2M0_TARER|nr:hypothetical protein QVD17_31015 [Tagetes erecta]